MPKEKLEVVFAKCGLMRFISHLDLLRLFQRALRRADIPFSLTCGYNPHPKVSIRRALKLGEESDHEVAIFSLDEAMDPGEFKARLQQQLPDGIIIKEVSYKE